MSLLLDALNKADQERKRNQPELGINSQHEHASVPRTAKRAQAVIIAAIFLSAACALSYWFLQSARRTAPVVINTVAINTAPIGDKLKSETTSAAAQISPKLSAPPLEVSNSEPTDTRAEQIDSDNEQDIASLYQQNAHAEALALIAAANTAPSEILASEINAAEKNNLENNDSENINPAYDTNPTYGTTTHSNDPSTTPSSIHQFANLPDLHDLPVELLAQIPSLNYSEHNYHPRGGYVKINGDIKHTNEQLANQLFIDKILEDGMILHFNNYSFKMRALNSWVNM